MLALFHKGLGAPGRNNEIEVELGRIRYLNGGLFDVHELEKTYSKIQIDDKAFQRLFDFFDEWNWHLDTRDSASGKDINPDVIGYIFEKYINDRAQMGAYYTKEDITDYISKNCIIPWLFEEVKRNYAKAFDEKAWLWTMVKDSGTAYIYDAVKHGVPETGRLFDDLPEEIQKGFDPELENKIVDGNGPWLWELRKEWNKPAPPDMALPTEIYREVIERRKCYDDIKKKIENGEVREINDFITLNLNIRQFAQDMVQHTEDADFVRHFYKALSSITILDPTCGSGAFLFAAMNILEDLYKTCIEKMQIFINEGGKGKCKFFEDTLALVNAPVHPNLEYFIYKSIILNNLYGVDIMNEAVEIAKLRLFLKLMATVNADYRKPNLGLEPLPDVDFNIRAGNTLVGYATKKQINDIAGMFVTEEHKSRILEQCDVVSRAFTRYKEIQLSSGDDYKDFKGAKDELNDRLRKLTSDLDRVLYIDQYDGEIKGEKEYDKWQKSHKPFHWFAEFYEIVQGNNGFDVVIGNPLYVEYSKNIHIDRLSNNVLRKYLYKHNRAFRINNVIQWIR
ncbi:SAM-dependent methyltransferase, partial [Patescibacteria group bacterium]|nr:SAM-dependent methyltransferase [Patescibacteria group bacterium]